MKVVLIFSFLWIALIGKSQETGYFGKKNVISFNGLFNSPLIYNLFSNLNSQKYQYKNENDKLVQSNRLLNTGFNFSYIRQSSSNFGFGFETGMKFSTCRGPRSGNFYYPTQPFNPIAIEFKHERLNISTFSIMPKIEFSTENYNLPMGIHGTLGLGYSRSKIKEKEYLAEFIPNPNAGWGSYINPEDFDSKKVFNPELSAHVITIMLGFNMRTPISKHLFFNYGLRYSFNYTINSLYDPPITLTIFDSESNNPNFYVRNDDMRNQIFKSHMANVAVLNCGFSFVF